jgi:hypothetical protein
MTSPSYHPSWISQVMKLVTMKFTPSSTILGTNYPSQHPVCGKDSYCHRTPDNIRNESITSIGLWIKRNVRSGGSERHYIYYKKKCWTEIGVTQQCPLVLLVNVGYRQFGTLESEEDKVEGCGMFRVRSQRNLLTSYTRWYSKYSGLVPSSVQQLW